MGYEGLDRESLIRLLGERDRLIEQLMGQLEKESYHASIDEMTGTFNRRAGITFLKEQMAATQMSNNVLTVCFIDIDGLKQINDTFGHSKGDESLINMCRIVKKCIRDTDFIFRAGGDEFLVVFPKTSVTHAAKAMERIVKEVEELNEKNTWEYKLRFSYGFSEYNLDSGFSAESLIEDADRKMYDKKAAKKIG